MKTGNLDQTKLYSITGHKYVQLVDGGGCACDNCCAIIANHIFITDGLNKFVVGPDCAENLSSINKLDVELAKEGLKRQTAFYKKLAEFIKNGIPHIIEGNILYKIFPSIPNLKIKAAQY